MTWVVSMYVCKYETLSSFHLYFGNHNLKLNQTLHDYLGYAFILSFTTSEVKQMWHMYKYVLKHPLTQDIFKQHIEMLVQSLYLDFSFI